MSAMIRRSPDHSVGKMNAWLYASRKAAQSRKRTLLAYTARPSGKMVQCCPTPHARHVMRRSRQRRVSEAPASLAAAVTFLVMLTVARTKATYASPTHRHPGERLTGVAPATASGNEQPEAERRRARRRGSVPGTSGGGGGSTTPALAASASYREASCARIAGETTMDGINGSPVLWLNHAEALT